MFLNGASSGVRALTTLESALTLYCHALVECRCCRLIFLVFVVIGVTALLFVIMYLLPGDPARAAASGRITGGDVRRLELLIESKRGLLDGSVRFIVPGSCPEAARLHVATAVCRRAEREVVRLSHAETVSPEILSYINRLSDALHALARASETDPIDVGK